MTLGDSHCLFNFAAIDGAKFYWRGAVTMHRAARDGIRSLMPRNCRPGASDILIISLGEIDSRAHIPKLAKANGRTSIEETDFLCDRFDAALANFRRRCQAIVALSCVIPFNPDQLSYEHYQDAAECRADAKAIRDQMNSRLANMGVPFVDFRDGCSNADGSIRKEFSDDHVHLDPRLFDGGLEAVEATFGIDVARRVPPFPPYSLSEPDFRYRRAVKAAMKAQFFRALGMIRKTQASTKILSKS